MYVPFKQGDVTPDSSLSNAVMSSLQWRDIERDQAASSTMSADEKVLQAWNFDNISAVYNDLCIALSGQQQHVMLRNASLSCIEYMQLSCLSVICDSQGASDQKSIEWLTTDHVAPMELQLYQFDTAEAESPDINTDYYVARRQTGTGPQLVYLPLSSPAISVDITPDSDMSASQVSSLQWREVVTEQSAVVGKVMQAFNFSNFEDVYADAADALSNEQHLMLRNADTKRLEYLSLSSVIPRVDSEGFTGQKSVSWLSGQHDEKELQLYGMNEEGEELTPVVLSTTETDILPEDYEFVVRKNGAGGEIAYAAVKLIGSQVSGTTLADSDVEDSQTSSL